MGLFKHLAKSWHRDACVSLQHVFEPVHLLLIPLRSLLHPPSSSVPALSSPPLALLSPSPITPYLDRSHDCCDTSWLTAHLHVFQLHSLVREMGGMEGPRSRWRGAEGLRESEVLWGNYGLSENIMKREKP